ncbi:MAG: rRNA maturation RNase YbeY [Bacteroidota bacterium]
MESSGLSFFVEDVNFELADEQLLSMWLLNLADVHQNKIDQVNYIFCSDPYLLKLNQEYLQHNYFTDILTFPSSPTQSNGLAADIYISIDRVKDNASTHNTSFDDELHRVMSHGLLHLIGFSDHEPGEKEQMRIQEDKALELRPGELFHVEQ